DLKPYIFSCGFYNNKGNNIIAMSKALVEKYDGKVPEDFDALVSLPGVGRKTASVVLCVGFDKPAMPVDTHVNRVSKRIGLSDGSKDPLSVEMKLKKCVEPEYSGGLCHRLVDHGRAVCTARTKPHCEICCLKEICKKNGV
ncbi:MAG: endonuclease III, partial [Lachnospiraceae bacterium]|nr:endonuclease III [Lachnospiraceae bacterium]